LLDDFKADLNKNTDDVNLTSREADVLALVANVPVIKKLP